MSDESLHSPRMTNDAIDSAAPTERAPSRPPAPVPPPSRGSALSVLWWREGDDKEDEQKPETD